jgi:quinol monooxygenase YgiN
MDTRRCFLSLLVLALASTFGPSWAIAEEQYAITYVELQPRQANVGRTLLDRLTFDSLDIAGVINFSSVRQIGRANKFILVGRWTSPEAYQAYKLSPTWTTFFARVQPLLVAPLDERPGFLLKGGEPGPRGWTTGVVIVTHLDIIPNFVDQAVPVLRKFVEESQSDPGVVVFKMLSWTPTTNHFQLVEVFETQRAFDDHITAPHTIAFRQAIQAFIGAPYDERVLNYTSHYGPIQP